VRERGEERGERERGEGEGRGRERGERGRAGEREGREGEREGERERRECTAPAYILLAPFGWFISLAATRSNGCIAMQAAPGWWMVEGESGTRRRRRQ
jgi:hypothetical protein